METLLHSMLTENTGIALCDSGGANGRAWQRNQGKTVQDFGNEPYATWEGYQEDDGIEMIPTVSVFHYLQEVLELDELCEKFNALPCEDWDGDLYGISKAQQEWLDDLGDLEIKDAWNSYNGDNWLSQILQGTPLEIDGEEYLLLQIHGGADVRGGYTDAKLFKFQRFQECLDPCPLVGFEYNGESFDCYEYCALNEDGEKPQGKLEDVLKAANSTIN